MQTSTNYRPEAGEAPEGCEGPHSPVELAAVAERLPGERACQEVAEAFRVLSDPRRVRLIAALLEGGELCVGDLSAASGLPQTACSHNLRLLRLHRIVRHRKQGRHVFYSLDDEHIRVLLDVALAHVHHADDA